MQIRGLLAGAVLLAALGGGVWWSQRNEETKKSEPAADAPPKLVNLKAEDIRKIEVRRTGSTPVVIERSASDWKMSAPEPLRVDGNAASDMANTFAGLTWDRLVEEKSTSLAGFGLQPPVTEIVASLKSGGTRNLLLGDETPTGGSFYAKLANDPRIFAILSGTKTSLDRSATDLRDKRLLTFDDGKLTGLEIAGRPSPFTLAKADGEWRIVKPAILRAASLEVEELIRKLKEASLDPAVAPLPAAPPGPRIARAALTTSAGIQTLDVFKKGADYFAQSSVTPGTYKIAGDLGTSLEKKLDDYRERKLFAFGFDDPQSIDWREPAKTLPLKKSGEKWFSNGKEMDNTSVQSFVDKLRGFTATAFAPALTGQPFADAAVISNNGKRTEKIQIRKDNNRFLAQREGESTVYVLDEFAAKELTSAAADVKPSAPPAKPGAPK